MLKIFKTHKSTKEFVKPYTKKYYFEYELI